MGRDMLMNKNKDLMLNDGDVTTSSDKERFMKRRSCSFKNFSNIFGKQFNMLMLYFISVIFSIH